MSQSSKTESALTVGTRVVNASHVRGPSIGTVTLLDGVSRGDTSHVWVRYDGASTTERDHHVRVACLEVVS